MMPGHAVRGLLLWRVSFPLFFILTVILSCPAAVNRGKHGTFVLLVLWLVLIMLLCLGRVLVVKRPTKGVLVLLAAFAVLLLLSLWETAALARRYDLVGNDRFSWYSDPSLFSLSAAIAWLVLSLATLVSAWKLEPIVRELQLKTFPIGNYCPHCLIVQDGNVCTKCGRELVKSGWCDTCREQLPRSPGSSCPTHWSTLMAERTLNSIEVLMHINTLYPAKFPIAGKYLDLGLSLVGSWMVLGGCSIFAQSLAERDGHIPGIVVLLVSLVFGLLLLIVSRLARR
jgi:hypothetical protein